MFAFDVEFIWLYSKNYKIYDLIYAMVSFLILLSGIILFYKNGRATLVVLCSLIFIVYQVLGWSVDSRRYLAMIELNPSVNLVVVPYDVGAFSSSNFVNLEISQRYALLFIKNKAFKSVNDVMNATLSKQDGNTVTVEFQTYEKVKTTEAIAINKVLEH
jgi:hypothetical protein